MEIYNDLNAEVVNFFFVARDRGGELIRALELTPFARDEFELSYLPAADPIEGARRFVARSLMGFDSAVTRPNRDGTIMRTGFRTKSFLSGTPPSMDWRNYPGEMPALIERLRGVVIEQRDAIEVMERYDAPDALHYVDPPYVHSTRKADAGGAVRAYSHEMTDDDHRELAACLHSLKGAVVLSGYPSDLYDQELFPDWERIERPALANGDSPRMEVLWLRNVNHGLFAATA